MRLSRSQSSARPSQTAASPLFSSPTGSEDVGIFSPSATAYSRASPPLVRFNKTLFFSPPSFSRLRLDEFNSSLFPLPLILVSVTVRPFSFFLFSYSIFGICRFGSFPFSFSPSTENKTTALYPFNDFPSPPLQNKVECSPLSSFLSPHDASPSRPSSSRRRY